MSPMIQILRVRALCSAYQSGCESVRKSQLPQIGKSKLGYNQSERGKKRLGRKRRWVETGLGAEAKSETKTDAPLVADCDPEILIGAALWLDNRRP
jgi:hypothetical protein